MKKKIQITAIVKEYKELTLRSTGKTVEDFIRVEYETGKHDSISDAEADLLTMMDNTQASGEVTGVELSKSVYNIVECYKDEMDLLDRYPNAVEQLEILKKDYLGVA
jgi:hypothetical protein